LPAAYIEAAARPKQGLEHDRFNCDHVRSLFLSATHVFSLLG